MTVARYFVLLVIILPCYVESAGSFWLTTQPPSVLQCDPRGRVRSHVKLECAVTGPEGSTLRISWYHWDDRFRATSGNGEFGVRGKQLLKSKQRKIGAEGRFNSVLQLPGAGLFGCYACQADSTKPQHLTAASNVLCFRNSDYKALPPCTGTLLVDNDHAVQLKRSPRHIEVAESLQEQGSAPLARSLFHSSLRKNAPEPNNSGRQDLPTAIYVAIGVCVCFVISIVLLMTVISGLCCRRHARRKVSSPSTTVTIAAANGMPLESNSLSSTSPLRMSAFSRTQSDGDLANRRVPRPSSDVEAGLPRRHRRCSEADSRDEALTRRDRSRSPYRIPLTIMPRPLTCPGVEQFDGFPFVPNLLPDGSDDARDESGHVYAYAGPSDEDDNHVRAKPNRRSYSEVIVLPQRVPSAELFDDPKYAVVCIAPAAAGVTSPLPPSQLNN